MAILATNLIDGGSGSTTQELYSNTISYQVSACSIQAAMAAFSLGSSDGTGIATQISAQGMPGKSDAVVQVLVTYTMNFGKLSTSGSLKSQQFSYDKDGTIVTLVYTDGGKTDSYTAIFNKRTPTGIYTATRYEQQDALDAFGDELGTTNSSEFLGKDPGLIMMVACDGDQVAPGWFNNRYVWEYDPDGFNPLISYFNRWGKIPPNIVGPAAPPPFVPGNGNGWVVPDEYDTNDFSGDFSWVEDLQP